MANGMPVTSMLPVKAEENRKDAFSAFSIVGIGYRFRETAAKRPGFWRSLRGKPVISSTILSVIVLGCLFSESIINHDPGQFYLSSLSKPPGAEFFFGTDSLGRDIYSIIWRGGRSSLLVGLLASAVSTLIGAAYGCVSGMASKALDNVMMRAVELIQSVPSLLTVLLIVSFMGKQNAVSLSVVIGVTSWFALARIVRGEVRQIRGSEYVLASFYLSGSRQQFHDRLAHNRLPAAGFPDDSQNFAAAERQRNAAYRLHFSLRRVKTHRQIPQFQNHGRPPQNRGRKRLRLSLPAAGTIKFIQYSELNGFIQLTFSERESIPRCST